MKKSVAIFLLAVLLPSVVLGWLALRNVQEQQIILERRTAELYQSETDNLAAGVRAIIDEQRRGFAEAVRKLLAARSADLVAKEFAPALAEAWPRKAVGFALGTDGRIVSPTTKDAAANGEWKRFLWDNGQFLSNQMAVMVYPVAVEDLNRPNEFRKKEQATKATAQNNNRQAPGNGLSKSVALPELSKSPMPSPSDKNRKQEMDDSAGKDATSQAASPGQAAASNSGQVLTSQKVDDSPLQQEAMLRNVAPQQMLALSERAAYSQLTWANGGFQEFTLQGGEGMLTRFVQDRLELIFWVHPEQAPQMVFGCLLEAESLHDLWAQALPSTKPARPSDERPEFILTLLDDKARPVGMVPKAAGPSDWKRPFVASEIGEALPHWEAALYLAHPEQLKESARGLRRTLGFLIALSLGAIACGGWLVVADTRRQLALAQKKTDFVSNVSHELKTPLTSIRMFAELMQSGRAEASRQGQYLRIIMVESERLTRLINNVLDFARIERKQKVFDRTQFDLRSLVERTWESQELHLQESGFTTRWQSAPGPYPVIGDEDAIAQILVNLLSNAEKYAGAQKEVELHSYIDSATVCVSVLDRGLGVPPGEEGKIFEAFYRAHDSLSSGIQGSGLGLTLAQRHAGEHGGEILCQSRSGGGSIFTLRLPLAGRLSPTIP